MCGDSHRNAHQIAVEGRIVEAREIQVRSAPRSFEIYGGIVMVDKGEESCVDSIWRTLCIPRNVRLKYQAQRCPVNQIGRQRIEETAQRIAGTCHLSSADHHVFLQVSVVRQGWLGQNVWRR